MQRPFYFGILRHLKSGALNATEFTLGTKQNKSFFSVDIFETGVFDIAAGDYGDIFF